jgi:hypothetical protein
MTKMGFQMARKKMARRLYEEPTRPKRRKKASKASKKSSKEHKSMAHKPKRRQAKAAKRTGTHHATKSPRLRKLAELEREATRAINQAKTARNFAKAAKDKGIKSLYMQAARHNIALAREAQKKALEILKSIK